MNSEAALFPFAAVWVNVLAVVICWMSNCNRPCKYSKLNPDLTLEKLVIEVKMKGNN